MQVFIPRLGSGVVAKQTPLVVLGSPPVLVTLPPEVAELFLTFDGAVVETIAKSGKTVVNVLAAP